MDDIKIAVSRKSDRFLDRVRIFIRNRGLAYTTEKTYIYWILFFIRFNQKKHPSGMGKAEVERFLSFLGNERQSSKSTQRTALNALIFLYREFLEKDLGKLSFNLSKKHRRIPVVFSTQEASRIIQQMQGITKLMIILMYGCGLRTAEVCSLRIKDIDFKMNQIIVREGKGLKDRVTLLPEIAIAEIKKQIAKVQSLHKEDLSSGYGEVYLPNALCRKYPNAPKETAWQYLFPSTRIGKDPRSGIKRRHHLHHSVLQKHTHTAIREANIHKFSSCYTFRHTFATQLLLKGYDIHTIQKLMGHSDISTTEIYLHVVKQGGLGVKSPADNLLISV